MGSTTRNPQTHEVRLVLPDGSETSLTVGADEHILDVAYREGLDLPSMCLQGWCITCAARRAGPGDWDQSDSLRYYPDDREAGFILLCTARPCSDLRVRTHQQRAMRDHRIALGLPAPRSLNE